MANEKLSGRREILFRGKRIDNGKWAEGSLLKVEHDGKEYSLIFGSDFRAVGGEMKAMSHAPVQPETVGQFTGMTDKNDNRIFEGDVVRYTNKDGTPAFYEIRWSKKHGAWMLRYRDSGNEGLSVAGFHLMVEVIGNIHDSPTECGCDRCMEGRYGE